MKTSVVRKNNKLLFNINGEDFVPSAYMTYVVPRGEYTKFKEIGYKLFFCYVQMGDCSINFGQPHIWKSEDEYDFSPIKDALDVIIGNSKPGDIYIALRVDLNVPIWWQRKYPNEVMENDKGEKWMQSPNSNKWKEDCVKFLSLMNDYIKQMGYSEFVCAWQLAGLATDEWFIPETNSCTFDFSPVGRKAFSDFCEKKYKSIENLNQIYKSNYNTFNDVSVPSFYDRYKFSKAGVNRDLSNEQIGADYFEFCGESVSNFILELAKEAKRISNNEVLIGAFYGYIIQLPAWRGHCSFKKVVESKDIDFFASPFAYTNLRKGAFDWFYHGPMQSAEDADKVWFLESDIRTFLTRPLPECWPIAMKKESEETKKYYCEPVWYGPDTEEQSKHHITKTLGKVMCSGNAYWWFDMWGGWYNTDGLMNHLSKLERLYRSSMLTGDKNISEIAILVDEKMSLYSSVDCFNELLYEQAIDFSFIGAPYDIYLYSDLIKKDFSKYKTIVFISPMIITDEEIDVINKLKSNNRSLLFSGFFAEYSNNRDCILDSSCELDQQKIVKENSEDYRIIWSPYKRFTAKEVSQALKEAEGFVYSDYGDIIYANERFIVWTATKAGERKLNIPKGKVAKIVINEKEFCLNDNVIKIKMDVDETVIIELKEE